MPVNTEKDKWQFMKTSSNVQLPQDWHLRIEYKLHRSLDDCANASKVQVVWSS